MPPPAAAPSFHRTVCRRTDARRRSEPLLSGRGCHPRSDRYLLRMRGERIAEGLEQRAAVAQPAASQRLEVRGQVLHPRALDAQGLGDVGGRAHGHRPRRRRPAQLLGVGGGRG